MSLWQKVRSRNEVRLLADVDVKTKLPDRENLYDYLPMFVKSFGEMREIFRNVDLEMDEIQTDIEFLFDNAFIDSADEYGISEYEKVLGILPADGEDLEIRRARVKIRWNDYLPYTKWTLRDKLDTICGVGMYQLIEDYENYYVSVRTQITSDTVLDEVQLLLEKILPAEMEFSVGQMFNTHGKLKRYTHGELHAYTHKQLKEDLDL